MTHRVAILAWGTPFACFAISYWARVGRACGEIGVGVGQIALGCAGMSAGAGMTSTGGGAVVGVPVIAESFAIAINGCATAANGVRNAGQLFREGAPPEAEPPPSQVKLLQPNAKPATQAPSATTTTTRFKDASGRTVLTIKKSSTGTTTTTRTKPTVRGGEPPGWRFLVAGDYEDVWQDLSLLNV